MKYKYLHKAGHDRLLIIFAGWGMDASPFEGLAHPAYDVVVAWDYRDLDGADMLPVHGYGEVCVMAWSMGVNAAQQIVPALGCPVSRCIAVNGTPRPVDDNAGIPVAVFRATLASLSEASLLKFYRRMCGGAAAMEQWSVKMPHRPIEELRAELEAIADRAAFASARPLQGMWDVAVLSADDAIFPIGAQRAAWQGVPTLEIDGPHLPDFQALIDRLLINKPLVSKRFTDASNTYDASATVQSMIAHELWQAICRNIGSDAISACRTIIEVGSGTGIFTAKYGPFVADNADWQLWDIAEVPESAVPGGARFCKCDAEVAIRHLPDSSVDAILSSSALQWLGSPMRFLAECKRVLRPGGLLAFSTFDSDNLPELRSVAPNSALLTPSQAELEAGIARDFALKFQSRNRYCIYFRKPRLVLEHMRDTGVNAIQSPSAAAARRILSSYPRTSTGRCPLTYIPLLFLATRP